MNISVYNKNQNIHHFINKFTVLLIFYVRIIRILFINRHLKNRIYSINNRFSIKKIRLIFA